MKKVKTADQATDLRQIPNIGEAIAEDLRGIGIDRPTQLKGVDAYELYVTLCKRTKAYHDPCVLDTFLAAIHFMDGGRSQPWWDFTETRKKHFEKVREKVIKFKNEP